VTSNTDKEKLQLYTTSMKLELMKGGEYTMNRELESLIDQHAGRVEIGFLSQSEKNKIFDSDSLAERANVSADLGYPGLTAFYLQESASAGEAEKMERGVKVEIYNRALANNVKRFRPISDDRAI
jgi:hypothetical protein